jgi:hypothetical protein
MVKTSMTIKETVRYHLRHPIFRVTNLWEALWEAYGILAVGFVLGFICCWIILK